MKIVKISLVLFMGIIPFVLSAQIGYQVSLLNSATGEPRAGETVEVEITLTNSEGATIYTDTQKETTNDFGILSLAIGNANTFDGVDWNKLPFFISASVDGKLIGKSQVLTVPVAEYAKKTGNLTKEILMSKTWTNAGWDDSIVYTFNSDNTGKWYRTPPSGYDDKDEGVFTYTIIGNEVIVFNENDANRYLYIQEKNVLVGENCICK